MPDLTELATRAARAPGWRWVAGMLARRQTGPCSGSHRYTDTNVRLGEVYEQGLPDLTDPATLGAIEHAILAPLGVVVERLTEPGGLRFGIARRSGIGWEVVPDDFDLLAEALVLGLEAASAVEERR